MSKIIAVEWRSGRDTVGIVLVEDEIDGYKAYIGVAAGGPEEQDAQFIKNWGARLSNTEMIAFFPWVGDKLTKG